MIHEETHLRGRSDHAWRRTMPHVEEVILPCAKSEIGANQSGRIRDRPSGSGQTLGPLGQRGNPEFVPFGEMSPESTVIIPSVPGEHRRVSSSCVEDRGGFDGVN